MIVRELFRNRETKGEVGIEIEVEGRNLATDPGMYWRTDHDGSLGGPGNIEYVMKNPALREDVRDTLDKVTSALEKAGSEVMPSPRSGVHVHINVQELTLPQVFSFIVIYGVFEDMLMDFCGKGRVGNLFCLSMKDAEFLPFWIRRCASRENWKDLPGRDGADDRYAAMNLDALKKYGSIEFRALRGTVDMKVIEDWAGILLKLKDFAKNIKHPKDIISMVSLEGAEGLAQKVFGKYVKQLWTKDWSDSIQDGMRLMQPIAYEVEIPVIKKKLNRAKPIQVDNQDLKDLMKQFHAHMQGK